MEKRVFNARMQDLSQILVWLHSQLMQFQLKPKNFHKIELAAEEALVNIIRYAYSQQAGSIEVSVKRSSNSVEIGLRDWGSAFNPLLYSSRPDSTSPLRARKEGGLGILLMTQLVDDVLYEWDGTSNFLILIQKIS